MNYDLWRPVHQSQRIVEYRRRYIAVIILCRKISVARIGRLRNEFHRIGNVEFQIALENIIFGPKHRIDARRNLAQIARLHGVSERNAGPQALTTENGQTHGRERVWTNESISV